MTATKTPAFHKPPMFTRQQLIALLLPLIAEQALSVTIGLADTLMVSSVGEAAVSGVSLVDSFNTLMIQIMSALATGGAVVTSQYIGRQEPKDAKNAAAQILFILSSFSLLVAAVVVAGRHAILRGIFGSIDVDVMRYAETYFLLSALSYPFIGLYNAGAALFRAQGNSKISMMSSLVMNVVNIGGNAVLIYGFKMGVMGAALASLVSRAIACVAVLYLLQRPACPLRVDGLQALAPKARLIQQILRVGIPAGIENGMFQIGKLSVSSLTSTLGTAAIAANAVAPDAVCLLRRMVHEPFGLPVCQQICTGPVQPLAGSLRHGAGSDGVVQHRFAVHLAFQLYHAQHPACGRRCPLYHDREHRVHVGLPGGLLLPVCAGLPRRPAGHLDGHVSGLGVPLPVLLCTLRARQVAGTAGHLNLSSAFYKSLPRRQALFYAIRTNNLFVFQQCCLLSFLFLSHSRRIISQC